MKTYKLFLFSGLVIIACAGIFFSGIYYGRQSVICSVCPPSDIDFSLFWTALRDLKEKFVDPSKITDQNILYGAITGMTESLGDPYTTFFTPSDAKKFIDELSGYFIGIGIQIEIKNKELMVVTPLKDSPAEQVGLRAGDKILKINNKSTVGMSTDEAVSLIRGERGTAVILNIMRDGWSKAKDFSITRDTIKIPSMEWKMMENDSVVYIKLYQFSQSLYSDFQKAAYKIMDSRAKKIILDLRNNPGGYLEVAQDVAGWFLENGKVVVTEDFGNGKEPSIYYAQGNAKFGSYPIIVLINEGSASASEILAGALKDNRGVKLVGQKSFGKGSVQEGMSLYDGSFLKITIAKWLTPNGISISEKGIEPDYKVEMTDNDYEQKKDPQLDKAIELLKEIQ